MMDMDMDMDMDLKTAYGGWGLTRAEQEFIESIDAFLDDWPNATDGPAHIILDDLNIETENLLWVIENFESLGGGHAEDELDATHEFLMAELCRRGIGCT